MMRSFTSFSTSRTCLGSERLVIEVEGQLFGSDIRSLLRSILAHDFMQSPVEQMGDGVMTLDRAAPRGIHRHTNGLAHFGSAASRQDASMNENVALFLSVCDLQTAHFRPVGAGHMDKTGIADLSAHLGVTRGAVDDQIEFIRRPRRRHGFDHGLGLEKVVAQELRRLDLEILIGDGDDFLLLSLGARGRAVLP